MQFLLLLLKKDNQEDTNNEVQSHLQLLCRGAAVDTLYSMQTVSRADFDAGETYLTLMERNYEALRKGLNE